MKALIALLCAPVMLSNAQPASFPSPFLLSVDTIPKIQCGDLTRRWSGTGARIDNDIILSATHVTDGSTCLAEGDPITLTHQSEDFAANRARPTEGLRMVISCAGIKEGEGYLAAGYAFGGSLVIERLIGTGTKSDGMHKMNGRVYSGMSGGPVVDDEGRLVAIINQKLVEVSGANVTEIKDTYLCV